MEASNFRKHGIRIVIKAFDYEKIKKSNHDSLRILHNSTCILIIDTKSVSVLVQELWIYVNKDTIKTYSKSAMNI